jgi:hypothetical protein
MISYMYSIYLFFSLTQSTRGLTDRDGISKAPSSFRNPITVVEVFVLAHDHTTTWQGTQQFPLAI